MITGNNDKFVIPTRRQSLFYLHSRAGRNLFYRHSRAGGNPESKVQLTTQGNKYD